MNLGLERRAARPLPSAEEPPVRATSQPMRTPPRLLMVFAQILLVVHLGRLFDYVLTGYHIPAVICAAAVVAAACGALHVLKTTTGRAAILFVIWMLLATPFSYWKGGSASYVLNFVGLPFVAMLIFAAAPRDMRDLKRLFYVTAVCAAANLAVGMWFGSVGDERLSFEGTFGNADDIAILAGFALPFWLFLFGQVRAAPLRLALQLAGAIWLLRVIGLSATRTGVIALAVTCFAFLMGLRHTRRVFAATAIVVGITVVAFSLPESALERFRTIGHVAGVSGPDNADENEALNSVAARQSLMRDALRITLRYPVFGIGPGQFGNYRGEGAAVRRSWQNAHSVYLQVSSESGIPGLVFYLLFVASIFRTIQGVRRSDLVNPSSGEARVGAMIVCLRLAAVFFFTCAFFMCATEYIYAFILAGLALAAERLLRSKAVVPSTGAVTIREPLIRNS